MPKFLIAAALLMYATSAWGQGYFSGGPNVTGITPYPSSGVPSYAWSAESRCKAPVQSQARKSQTKRVQRR
jgi:hypothetical protein